MTTRPRLPGVIEGIAERVARNDVRVLRAARVESYDASQNTATVQLAHHDRRTRSDGTTQDVAAPRLPDLPVATLLWGDTALPVGLSPGTDVYVAIRDCSHDEYDGGVRDPSYTPDSPRRWDYADAIVLPFGVAAIRSDGAPCVVMDAASAVFRVGSLTADEPVAMSAPVREELDALWDALIGHTHTYQEPTGPSVTKITSLFNPAKQERNIASGRLYTDDTIVPGTGVT